MKTLSEYNRELKAPKNKLKDGADVCCPICKDNDNNEVEMLITQPTFMLITYPGQQSVYCPVCGYKGYKLVY